MKADTKGRGRKNHKGKQLKLWTLHKLSKYPYYGCTLTVREQKR